MTLNKKLSVLHKPRIQFICAVALFVVSHLLAGDNKMAEWEKQLFHVFYDLPASFRPIFQVITRFGEITTLLVVALLFHLRKHYHIVIRLLLTGLLAYVVTGVAKDLLGRPRPFDLLVGVTKGDYLVRGPGFPSGHTALATAMALTLGRYVPKRYQFITPLIIISVAASRLILGVHAPLDIIGGFAIGWACYALFRNVRMADIHTKAKAKT